MTKKSFRVHSFFVVRSAAHVFIEAAIYRSVYMVMKQDGEQKTSSVRFIRIYPGAY